LYELKGVGEPEYYSGMDLSRNQDNVWSMSAKTYIKSICDKIELVCETKLKNYGSPLEKGDHPEMDDSDLLPPDEISKYQMLCGCAQWAVTTCRFDIQYATNTLARFAIAPREGHFKRMLRVFGYLKHHPKGRIMIDTSHPNYEEIKFAGYEWNEMYPDAFEEMPYDAPKVKIEKGRVNITCYVDADHGHDLLTRRSVTGYLIVINKTPVKWYSKRQNTVETSTYGSELVAARIATEAVMDYRYRLYMMGIDTGAPSTLLIDNQSVVTNTSLPSSSLKKKHNAIAYHRVREAVAAGIVRVGHVRSWVNIADILTKPLGTTEYWNLLGELFYGRNGQEPGAQGELQKNTVKLPGK
jgi:hypothetical protein